jgi:Protein of unknown function (DUF3667)
MPDPNAPGEPSLPDACLNCQQPLPAPRPKFCPACGQETNVRPPRLGEFVQQFGGAYFATEGALWRTLKLLLLQPGELTRQYLAGRRKHYVLPLRLYLTISVVVLLVMRTLSSVQFEVRDDELQTERPKSMSMNIGSGAAGLRDGVYFCEGLPQWMCKRLKRRIDIDPKAIRSEVAAMGERFIGNVGAAMFVLLPSFALWLRLVYRNRGLRYTEHLVFALHVHAFGFLMLALMLTELGPVVFAAVVAVPVYTLLAMRRVYGGRWWPRLLRAALVSLFYFVTMTLALVGVGLWVLLA